MGDGWWDEPILPVVNVAAVAMADQLRDGALRIVGADLGGQDLAAIGLCTVSELRWRRDRWEAELATREASWQGFHADMVDAALYLATALFAKLDDPLWRAQNKRQRKNKRRRGWGHQRA